MGEIAYCQLASIKRIRFHHPGTSTPVVLKVFFTFLPYKPKHCQFLPNKNHKW